MSHYKQQAFINKEEFTDSIAQYLSPRTYFPKFERSIFGKKSPSFLSVEYDQDFKETLQECMFVMWSKPQMMNSATKKRAHRANKQFTWPKEFREYCRLFDKGKKQVAYHNCCMDQATVTSAWRNYGATAVCPEPWITQRVLLIRNL